MNNELQVISTDVQRTSMPRKAYHSPRLEDYGAVNELTRSGPPQLPYVGDAGIGYTSIN